jgi:hypothetical protein
MPTFHSSAAIREFTSWSHTTGKASSGTPAQTMGLWQ